MKSLKIGLVIIILVAAGIGFYRQATPKPQPLSFKIEGMTCGSCVYSITSALTSYDNIETCDIQLETGLATCFGTQLTEQQIQSELTELGYTFISL